MKSSLSTRSLSTFLILAAGTVLGLAGTDLVLPAVPTLPREIGGGIASAQMVIAAFVAGTACGLVLFGALGPRFGRQVTIVAALIAYSILSLAAAFSAHIGTLIGLRFLQGTAASAPAVFAPAILRALFDESGATRALGALGSVESLVPALAPAAGAWLIWLWGWQSPFFATSILTALLAVFTAFSATVLPGSAARFASGSYRALLGNRTFARYAFSQACVLGGLLLFVFGAPSVIVNSMHGTIRDFVWMQAVGIACFILATTVTGHLVGRIGAERMIWLGTLLSACSALVIAAYAIFGNNRPGALIFLMIPLNIGLGLRGPPGFLRAILSARGDDERAASLTILAVMAVAGGGTALLAPVLGRGLVPLASGCAIVQIIAVGLLIALPRLPHSRKQLVG